MVTAIEDITLNQGIDPKRAVLIGGGGGAGLYSAAIARRLGVDRVIIPEVAAALSAAGALLSDLTQDFAITAFATTRKFNHELAKRAIATLEQRCRAFIDGPGAGSADTEIRYSVEARYPNQVWEIEVPLGNPHFDGANDIEAFRQDFHRTHDQLFAVSDPGSEIEIVAWRAHVRCGLPRRPFKSGAIDSGDRESRRRMAFFAGYDGCESVVRRYESVRVGERIDGPAIIESPVTTVVVPPDASIERLESGSLALDLRTERREGAAGAMNG
jgi:N-methylhydantoinase A